ncbi:MAG: type II toxin-antitoxin system CcdA family antitoxin, partial [Proteobacteria bacterium]|nr:type II toxin-antitoxin system CcdA family antitoxin [Pseudomonadota bacterium]
AQWKVDNREAIEAYNARIEQDGIWSDGLRAF